MPEIKRYTCNRCNFELPAGWGGYTYAVDGRGRREVCGHPSEFSEVERITGLTFDKAMKTGRAGYAKHCVCIECLKQFDLDLERDAVVCPGCSSRHVRTLANLIGGECPRCKEGVIEEGPLIRWKLDPGWERLPVPQIVKDLVAFEKQRTVSPSLQQALDAAGVDTLIGHLRNFGGHHLFRVTQELLSWWEGDYFSRRSEPMDWTEMSRPQTHEALQSVLRTTPALSELVSIRDGRCWFAEGVTAEVRRGIKNYVRKHREHVVMT